MRRAALLLLTCALLTTPGLASARRVVMVELFTAQGCSSCAKANALIAQLADRPGLIALTWPVDYWDYLGWKDTFAQPQFADRQRLYEHRLGLRDVYTPQVIVNGAAQAAGDKAAAIDTLIRQARRAPGRSPDIAFLPGGRVAVGSGRPPRGGAEVWWVSFDPRQQDVEVKAGDNRGATVPHKNVVRQLARLGVWTGRSRVFKAPVAGEGLTGLVIIQAPRGGAILGALKGPGAAP